jgi:DnaJ-class molecular chaperone
MKKPPTLRYEAATYVLCRSKPWVVVKFVCLLFLLRVERGLATTSSSSSSSSSSSASSPIQLNRNPYAILDVTPQTSSKDLKRKYYQLCLKFHPDKLQQLSKHQQLTCERTFKDIQWAYSEITSGRVKPSTSTSTSTTAPFASFTNGQPMHEAYSSFFQHFRPTQSQGMFRSSYNHFGTFPFSTATNVWNSHATLNTPKFIFRQSVAIPLSELYTGQKQYAFTLRNNIITRTMAAFRGGMGPYLLYQSILYALPLVRFSKIISFATFLFMLYQQLPNIPSNVLHDTLIADLLPGYKGATKLIFTSDILQVPNVEVQIVLQEENHPVYTRIQNDLHVTCTINTKQAMKGCILQIPRLKNKNSNIDATIKVVHRRYRQSQQYHGEDESQQQQQEMISIELPPNTQSGDTIQMIGEGWPIRTKRVQPKEGRSVMAITYGNLIVTAHVVEETMFKTRHVFSWNSIFRRPSDR